MRSAFAACLIVTMTSVGARAQTPPAPAPAHPASDASLRARLSEDVIRDAVRQTLASEQRHALIAPGTTLGAERYERFGREMAQARLPDCLHADALKFQPTFLNGLLAIPSWALAAVRGKCR